MQRNFLAGMASGAALTLVSCAIAVYLARANDLGLFIRVIDDNYDYVERVGYSDQQGPMSAKLARDCKIENFIVDLADIDYAGSTFVRVDKSNLANLNCLIGEARRASMSLSIANGIDDSPTDCIAGWPTRFQSVAAGGFQLCVGQRNPNPIFVPSPPLERPLEQRSAPDP